MLLTGAFLIGLAWLLPNHYFPWPAFQSEFVAALGAVLIGAAAWRTARKAGVVCWPPLAPFALALAAVPLLQWGFGQVLFVSDAVLSAAYLAGFGACVAAGATLARHDRAAFLDALTATLLVAGIVSTALALCQWLGLSLGTYLADLPQGGRPFANFGQPNHLATLLGMAVVALLRLYETRRIGAPAALLCFLYLAFGMVMTMSRTGWLFMALLALGCLALRRRAGLRLEPVVVLCALGAFAAGAVLWPSLNDALFVAHVDGHGNRVALEQRSQRLGYWQMLLDAVLRSPWSGYGWGQVPLAQKVTVLDHPYLGGGALTNSHNVAIDLLVWNGIPLGALILLALGAWFVRQFILCRSAERFVLLCAVAAVWLHGMLEYPLSYAYFLFPVGLLMGALDGTEPTRPLLRLAPWTLALPTLVLATLGGYVAFEYLQVESTSRVLRFVAAGIGVDKVSDAPEPEVVLLDRQRQFHRFMLTRPHAGMSDAEIAWVVHISDMNPFASSLFRQAMVLGLNGRGDAARATLARLCRTQHRDSCAEARDGWKAAQEKYPELRQTAFPQSSAPASPVH